MRVRIALIVLVLLALLLPLPLNAAGSEVLPAAMDALNTYYPDPVNPPALVNAALLGLSTYLAKEGCDASAIRPLPRGKEPIAHFSAILASINCKGKSKQELEFVAVEAMLASLNDSHTAFLRPSKAQEYREQERQRGFRYGGIGAMAIVRGGRFYQFEVFPGGPADRAGLKKFDRMLAIDGKSLEGLSEAELHQALLRIRGAVGSTVALTVQRPGVRNPITRRIVREEIKAPAVSAQKLGDCTGYMRLRFFGYNAGRDFEAKLRLLLQQDICALILDVRLNAGGFDSELQSVLSLFLPKDTVIYRARYKDRTETMATNRDPIVPTRLPIVVIMGRENFSAAELAVATLVDAGRAKAVGDQTAGAVELAYRLLDLPGGAGMSVTIARLTTGKGARLEGVGVAPTHELPLTAADLDAARDSQLELAMLLLRSTR